ncbi:MAG: EamA family transporter [Calditrichaeota bacterium]|nr:EamA family transporter [Calditrichota bacterium]
MINLILTVICSAGVALILKWSNSRKDSVLYLLLGNYLVAAIIGFVFCLRQSPKIFTGSTLVFGLFVGALFVFSFFAFSKAVGAIGASLATVTSRISVAIPVTLSILFYREYPNNWQTAGLLFVLITIGLFYLSLKSPERSKIYRLDFFYLSALWAGIGVGDFSMKVFQSWRGLSEKPFFLFVIFGSAFIYTLIIIKSRKEPYDKKAFGMGVFLGIPNLFSLFFFLNALNELPSIVVYPVVNLGVVLLTAASSRLIWKERLNRLGKLALIVGSLAIILLNANFY